MILILLLKKKLFLRTILYLTFSSMDSLMKRSTVDLVYNELGYSESACSDRVSPHRSLIYSKIKYVYSEYMSLVNYFCCTDPFIINEIDCSYNEDSIILVKNSSRTKS